MIRRTIAVGALAVGMIFTIGAAPAGAATDKAGTNAAPARSQSKPASLAQLAGTLHFSLDGYACRSAGGAFGHGFVGARGYMDEIGATNVNNMKITIVA